VYKIEFNRILMHFAGG